MTMLSNCLPIWHGLLLSFNVIYTNNISFEKITLRFEPVRQSIYNVSGYTIKGRKS